ncbi:hypothetical protein LUZ60_017523 [Juncus effusus]|nr:hypothetical protein LUZ60_017523 [Juncus effusus]
MKKQVFILAGQSNMAGRGGVHWSHNHYVWDGVVPPECAPSPSILRLSVGSVWEEARDPLHFDVEPKSKTGGVGPGMIFGNGVLKVIGGGGAVVGLVPCAVGGTAIKEWKKGSKLYNQMIRRAKESMEIGDGGEIKAVLWYQGESDCESDHASETYGENLERFIKDVRYDLGFPCLPFIQVALASGEKKNIDKVRKAQLGLNMTDLVCVDAMGLALNPDKLHLTTNSQVKLGEMLAEAYITKFMQQSSAITRYPNDHVIYEDTIYGLSELYSSCLTLPNQSKMKNENWLSSLTSFIEHKYFSNKLSVLISFVVVSVFMVYIVYYDIV